MTTKNSPRHVLEAQARQIAVMLKRAERGDRIDVRFAEKIVEARRRGVFKIGIAMDDKMLAIDIPWTTVQASSEASLIEYIVGLMQETTPH